MACCLAAPSHYMNPDWLITSDASDNNLKKNSQELLQPSIKEINLKISILFKSPSGQWVNDACASELGHNREMRQGNMSFPWHIYSWLISTLLKESIPSPFTISQYLMLINDVLLYMMSRWLVVYFRLRSFYTRWHTACVLSLSYRWVIRSVAES